LALSMLIDIFSERGYHAVIDKRLQESPVKVEKDGTIKSLRKTVFRIQIHFQGSNIRRG
jgi:adenylate kinase